MRLELMSINFCSRSVPASPGMSEIPANAAVDVAAIAATLPPLLVKRRNNTLIGAGR